ncbi:hypothetical protein CDAR_609321 [Caerostris darwini]|uniref:Uncharacterized protein n=1 Tax=Caerostris darwini TaxID=1538125 RepID=A0AAV4UNL2_9ARAC|nr:hypothetical protein CDAR_609321 [Caerostris darwini]
MAHSSTDCSTLLISSKHAIWSRRSSELCLTICNRNWHRAAPHGRFMATVNLFHQIKLFLRRRYCFGSFKNMEEPALKICPIFPADHNHSHSSDHLSCRAQPSNKWLIPPLAAPPFLLARNTPFGRGDRLNFAERPVTVTGIELPRIVGSGQPSICSTRLGFAFEVDSVSGLSKIWR